MKFDFPCLFNEYMKRSNDQECRKVYNHEQVERLNVQQ